MYMHGAVNRDFPSSIYVHFTAALALKGVEYEYKPIHLLQDGGQQVNDYELD